MPPPTNTTPPTPSPPPVPSPPPAASQVELIGKVAALHGSCPALDFKIGSTRVAADERTTYQGGTCTSLRNGVRVRIEGLERADGTVQAQKIEIGE